MISGGPVLRSCRDHKPCCYICGIRSSVGHALNTYHMKFWPKINLRQLITTVLITVLRPSSDFLAAFDLFPVSVYFVDVVLPVPTTNLGLVSHARAIAARAFSFCPYRGWKSISTPYICESSIIGRLHTRLARVAGCCKFACLSQRNISIIIIIR